MIFKNHIVLKIYLSCDSLPQAFSTTFIIQKSLVYLPATLCPCSMNEKGNKGTIGALQVPTDLCRVALIYAYSGTNFESM